MAKKDELEPLVWNHTRVLNKPLHDESLSTYEKMAFVALSTFADSKGGRIFPSYQTIAKLMSCSDRKAKEAVNALCERGYLVKKNRRGKDGSLTSNIYSIAIPPSARGAQGVVHEVHKGSARGAQELYPLNENQLNESESPSAPAGSSQTLVAEFIMLHQDTTGETPAKIPQASGIFKQLLKYHPYETISGKLKAYYTQKHWFTKDQGYSITSFSYHYDEIKSLSPGGNTEEQPVGEAVPWDEMMSDPGRKE